MAGEREAEDELPAMKDNPKYIFFTDFDGTITLDDSNDYMTDNLGFGRERRIQGNKDVLEGKATFRDSFQQMINSITVPFPRLLALLPPCIPLDPTFPRFLHYAQRHSIPLVVISGGMRPIVSTLLTHHLTPHVTPSQLRSIQIVANDVKPREGHASLAEEGGWDIQYHDGSAHGHDKSLTIRPYARLGAGRRPWLFYAGDGVSDLSAAREADLLFAKRGRDLVHYCVKEGVRFCVWEDWGDILEVVEGIVDGRMSVEDAAGLGYEQFLRDEEGEGNQSGK